MNIFKDVRYGLRMLRKSPGFTLIATLTLGVGIGVTSAVYSICDAMLWKPVSLPHLETLVVIQEKGSGGSDDWANLTPADFEDIRRGSNVLENIACWRSGAANIAGADGEPEGVLRAQVSANFFDAAGVKPAVGRAFQSGEDQPGHEREVILSHRLWRNRFGADPAVVGKTIRLDGQNFEVVGVMPESYDFPLATEVWVPNALQPAEISSRTSQTLTALARLRPGRTVEQATSELEGISARLASSFPETNSNRRLLARPAHRFFVNNQREQYLVMLLGSVLFVLLIACVNVANLQFARAQGRLNEVALRTALGATRGRIVTQFVTESVLLAVPGAALGLLLAYWSMSTIKAAMPPELVRFVYGWKDIELDGRVLAFTLAAAAVGGILAGLVPALQCSRPNLTETLKEGGRTGTGGGTRHVLRNILVGAEITFAVVLLVGAGLMVRGFRAQVDTGSRLDPSTLLTMRLALGGNTYREPHQVYGFYRDALSRIGAVPGVRSAAAVTALPYSGRSESSLFTIEGRVVEPGNVPRAMYQTVSPSYFELARIPLREGRLLGESDGPEAPRVAVVSERLASRWWPHESPVGKHIRVGGPDSKNPSLTVVGIVGDITQSPYDREPRPAFYVPYQQSPSPSMDIAVRTEGDPQSLARGVMAAIHEVDHEQPVMDVRTMETAIYNSAIGLNFMAALMGVFGLLALCLSAVGVYGVMAHLVSEQTREIGIRIALGARRQNVILFVFRRGLVPVAAGLLLGLPLAWGFSRFLASVIYGVTATDPVTFVGVPAALLAAGLLAILLPARRAMKIDPVNALRGS